MMRQPAVFALPSSSRSRRLAVIRHLRKAWGDNRDRALIHNRDRADTPDRSAAGRHRDWRPV